MDKELRGTSRIEELESLPREVEDRIRDKMYDNLHTPVVNRLRALGLMAVKVMIQSTSPDSFRTTLAGVDQETREIIREIRRIVAPSWHREAQVMVEENSRLNRFVSDINGYAQRVQEQFGMEVELRYSPQEMELLDPQQFLPIQDILLNLLYNAAIHAKARKALIHFYASDQKPPSTLTLNFTSDGEGHISLNDIECFVSELPESCRGLRAVVTAVKDLGAELQSSSSPDSGTTIAIYGIPVIRK